jgi:cell division transport system ATP-binding protein
MIQLHNVSKRYSAGHEALHEVSFRIGRGEMAFITGHSGAGKSTLLKLLGLIERPSSGDLVVNERNLSRLSKRQIPYYRRSLGLIYQDFRLLTDRTVYENVALPLIVAGQYERQEIGRRTRAALDKVGLLGKEKYRPLELSGGEQQRVGIARAVVHKPVLLLADEPTGNLDAGLAGEIMALFEAFNRVGVTVLIASHNTELIARTGRRVISLHNGRLSADAASEA